MKRKSHNYTNSNRSTSGQAKVIIVALIVLALLGGLGYVYAKNNKLGPFANTGSSESGSSNAIEIKRLKQDKETLAIELTKKTEEKGYCILNLKGKDYTTTLNEADLRKKLKSPEEFDGCGGWTINTKDVPAGDYTVTVTFKGKSESTVSGNVTLN